MYEPTMQCNSKHIIKCFSCLWRDVLETVIIRRKLTDAQANPSTQRKRYLSPVWQFTLNFIRQEQLYALLKNKRKETYIKSNTPHK